MTTRSPFDRRLICAAGDSDPRPHSNCYWVVPGLILAGEYPGASMPTDCVARIDALLDAGVRQFVNLVCESEEADPYATMLMGRAALRQVIVAHQRFAIADFGVPSMALMRAILDAIYAAVNARQAVYVHCLAGIGRTGTAVGCLFRDQGLTAAEAIDLIAYKWLSMEKRSRHPRSPERPGQFALIEAWPSGGGDPIDDRKLLG